MRLIIMGQQAFGKDCLEAALEKGKVYLQHCSCN
jgi:hypothetical protein